MEYEWTAELVAEQVGPGGAPSRAANLIMGFGQLSTAMAILLRPENEISSLSHSETEFTRVRSCKSALGASLCLVICMASF